MSLGHNPQGRCPRSLRIRPVEKDAGADKLKTGSYEKYFGHFDAREAGASTSKLQRLCSSAVLRWRACSRRLPREEVAMLLQQPKQQVEAVFRAAGTSDTVQDRSTRNRSWPVLGGVKAGLFGYAESVATPPQRGEGTAIVLDDIRFSGVFGREDTPVAMSSGELAKLIPESGPHWHIRPFSRRRWAATRRACERAGLLGLSERSAVCRTWLGYASNAENSFDFAVESIDFAGPIRL